MTQQNASVVTPQRFSQGHNYSDYMGKVVKVNKARMEGFYNDFKVKPEHASALRALAQKANGPAKMLIIGEDWCGDVVRGLPMLARVAEAAGLEMRIFPRDQHLDIMNEFLNQGKYQSIPVAVFYTRDNKYICHWIERPAVANKEQAEIEKAIRAENPNITDQEFSAQRRTRTGARAADWQQASVAEMVEMLQKSVK